MTTIDNCTYIQDRTEGVRASDDRIDGRGLDAFRPAAARSDAAPFRVGAGVGLVDSESSTPAPYRSTAEAANLISASQPPTRRLAHGDCLDVLQDSRQVEPGTIGLVYLDPPYETERLFSAGLRRDRAALVGTEPEAFDDHWASYVGQMQLPKNVESIVQAVRIAGGPRLGSYIRFMTERLVAMRQALSPTASVYLHVSPPVAPYLRLVLDVVLGAACFRNEISWKRTHAHSSGRRYGPVHDTILFYARPGYQWSQPTSPVDTAYVAKHFRDADAAGRPCQLVTCSAPGDRTGTKAHFKWHGRFPPAGRHWAWKTEEMRRLEKAGRIRYSRNGTPRRVYYADEHRGTLLQDVWTDLPRLDAHSDERIGYETQKPLALLRRIISASAPRDGELVFDGFVGTGTTLLAASAAGIGWIGCDTSLKAVLLAVGRLSASGAKPETIRLRAGPTTTEEARHLAEADGDAFGVWATGLLGMLPDPVLQSRHVLFARARNGARAVAGPAITASQLRTLAGAPGDERYSMSVTPAPRHPNVMPIPMDRLTASACRGRVPVDAREIRCKAG